MNKGPRRIRRAARILLMDEHDRLLLIRFAPADRRPFWCGVGGECDPGEDGEPITSDERFFRVRTRNFIPDTTGHTAIERELIKEFRWFTRAELANWPEPVFPVSILDLLDLEAQT